MLTAMERLEELKAERDVPRQRDREIEQLEQQVVADREAGFCERANRRLLGISRAHGSLRSTLDEDTERLVDSIQTLREALERDRGRRNKLSLLEAEARALLARWPTLQAPTMTPVPTRDVEDDLFALTRIPRPTRPHRFQPVGIIGGMSDPDKRRATLRSLAEYLRNSAVADTDGGRLVMAAGLDVEPTDKEKKSAERREQQAEQERAALARFTETRI